MKACCGLASEPRGEFTIKQLLEYGQSISMNYLQWRHNNQSVQPKFIGDTLPGESVILGCAAGYRPLDIAMFVKSMRRVHDGPAALVVYDSPEILAYLQEHRIQALAIPERAPSFLHIVVRRFAYIAEALRERSEWRRAFVCDTRDVVFQRSPFEDAFPCTGLEVHQERESGPLKRHRATMKWTKRAFGADVARLIEPCPSLCGGSILFERDSGLNLFAIMDGLFSIPRASIGGAFGTDQAALNYAVHAGMIAASIAPNLTRVATIGAERPSLKSRPDGRLQTQDGKLPAVVHQFDRYDDYTESLESWCGAKFHRSARLAGRSSVEAWFTRKLVSISTRTPELR
jgi:hypothetical protein